MASNSNSGSASNSPNDSRPDLANMELPELGSVLGNEADTREARRLTAEEIQRERRQRATGAGGGGRKKQKQNNLIPGQPVRAMNSNVRRVRVTQVCDFMGERRTANRRIEGVPTDQNPYWDPNYNGGTDAVHSVVDLRDYTAEELEQIRTRKQSDMYVDVYEEEDYIELPPPTKEQRIQIQHDIDRLVRQVSEVRHGIQGKHGEHAAAVRRANESRVIPPEEQKEIDESWERLQKALQEADTLRPRSRNEDPFSLMERKQKEALLGENKKKFERHTVAKTLHLQFRPRMLPHAQPWTPTELELTRLMNGENGLAFVYRKPVKDNLFEYRFRIPRVETDVIPELKGFAWDINLHFSVELRTGNARVTHLDRMRAASAGAKLRFVSYHFTFSVPGRGDPEDEYAAVTRAEGQKKKRHKMAKGTAVFVEKRNTGKPPVKGVHTIPSTGIAFFTGSAPQPEAGKRTKGKEAAE